MMYRILSYDSFIVGAAFALNFFIDGVRLSYGLLLTEFMEYFHTGHGETSGISALLFAVVNCTAPLASMVLTRFGCRRATMFAGGLCFLGVLITSYLPGLYYMYASVGIVTGLGFSIMFIAKSVIIIQHFKDNRVVVFGISSCGAGIGGLVFNLLLNHLIQVYTWRGGLLVISAVLLNACVAGALMRPPEKRELNKAKNDTDLDNDTNGQRTYDYISVSRLEEDLQEIFPDGNITPNWTVVGENKGAHTIKNVITSDQQATICENEESLYPLETFEEAEAKNLKLKKKFANSIEDKTAENLLSDTDRNSKTSMETDHKTGIQVLLTDTDMGEEAGTKREMEKSKNKDKRRIFNWSLMKEPKMHLFMASRFFFSLGMMTVLTYLSDFSVALGYSKKQAAILMSVLSISNVLWRLGTGFLGEYLKQTYLYNGALLGLGIVSFCTGFTRNYILLAVEAALIGGTLGTVITLFTVVLTEVFPDSLVPDALGLSVFGMGPGTLIGAPIAGWVVDITGNAGASFFIGGASIVASAVLSALSFRGRKE